MTTEQSIHLNRRNEIRKLLEEALRLAELEVIFPESMDRHFQASEVFDHTRDALNRIKKAC